MRRIIAIAAIVIMPHRAIADDNPVRVIEVHVSVQRHSTPRRSTPRKTPHVVTIANHGLVPTLAAKVREIEAACGSRMTSGVRHTLIAGTRRMSLHATGEAVDLVGNPGCIYAHLRDAAWGYSTDYGAVFHVHVADFHSRERGRHFAHNDFTHRRFASRRMRVA